MPRPLIKAWVMIEAPMRPVSSRPMPSAMPRVNSTGNRLGSKWASECGGGDEQHPPFRHSRFSRALHHRPRYTSSSITGTAVAANTATKTIQIVRPDSSAHRGARPTP